MYTQIYKVLKMSRGTVDLLITVYAIYFAGFLFFAEFRESGAIREFNNMHKLFTSDQARRMNVIVYAILVIQYTVHVQGRIATFAF